VTAALRVLPFIFVMTTGSPYAYGQQVTCYPIQVGDTAARLALEFTGDAHNRRQAWFQIVDPTTSTVIPKSRYAVIQSGWHVCVATRMLRPGTAQPRYELVSSAPVLVPRTDVTPKQTALDLSVLWWATPLFVWGFVLAWVVTGKYIDERRASLAAMRGFGARFVSEFDRPLFRRCANDPAVRSRLRLSPARHRLEILLVPADGRTYPNLMDHKKNVEYDVARVVRILRDGRFINGALHTEGRWVVIPFRFKTDTQQEGVP
jgi:hypothetical protein